MKRLLAAFGAAVMVISVAAVSGGTSAQAAPAEPAVATATMTWRDCGGGLQCATLTVPMDYANPGNGQTVKLALTRQRHTKSPYRGMMLTNPGGPGASGTYLPYLTDYVPYDAGAYYDWVGFDPRGVGQSTPSLHCNSRYFGTNRPNFVPSSLALMRYWVAKTKQYADQCGASTAAKAGLLKFVTTRDTVRDMESIRAAYQADANLLDQAALDKLNFYGFSYGTYLGQVYAITYPARVGRFVLDGVIDPTSWWYKANLSQEIRFDLNLRIYFQWIAAHPRVFKLGTDWRAIKRGYYAQLRKLDARPAANGRLGPDELADAMLGASYYVFDWDGIGRAYSDLVRRGNGGALFAMYADGNMGDDNGYAMYLATQCTDVAGPAWKQQVADAWRIHRSYPFMAWNNTWYNAPCRFWKAPAQQRIAVSGTGVTAPILMINETFDAATPFGGALNARARFPSARLIEGVRGTTHSGSLSGVACVDNRIGKYLLNGAIPARKAGRTSDVSCPKVPPPPVASARISARAMPLWLRHQIIRAERVRG